MEILLTIAYFFLVRLIFFDYKLIVFNLFWKFLVFGLYAAAALTEIVLLGQYGPYSKELVVESYVVQIAPDIGGLVKEVYALPNKRMKKGDPLFEMDPAQWKQRLSEAEADLDVAQDEYKRLERASRTGAVSAESVVAARDQVRTAKAGVEEARYNLDHTVIRAPADGYAVNVMLRAGTFIRLKQAVITFVSTEEYFLVATVNQRAARYVKAGNDAEIALTMYPGQVFEAVVEDVIWAGGGVQLVPGGRLPELESLRGSEFFAVKLRVVEDDPNAPLRFGATGMAAIYTGRGPDVFKLLRQLEIRSESWLNYLYNPF